jgi:hypothetical protein
MTTKERPIIFSAPMVRAILDGRKSQTRRVVKPQPVAGVIAFDAGPLAGQRSPRTATGEVFAAERCPYGAPGDRLWAREAHCAFDVGRVHCRADYASDPVAEKAHGVRWSSPIHMPRWASRITLEVIGVRVERLQSISEADAMAEGVNVHPDHHDKPRTSIYSPVQAYRDLWESINGAGSWGANPWVWVVEFRQVTP